MTSALARERQLAREARRNNHNVPEEVDVGELRRQRAEHQKAVDRIEQDIGRIERDRAVVAEHVKNGATFPAALCLFDVELGRARQRKELHTAHIADLDERLAAQSAA
jgi:hypothetical protein